jgi:hypothetical protein
VRPVPSRTSSATNTSPPAGKPIPAHASIGRRWICPFPLPPFSPEPIPDDDEMLYGLLLTVTLLTDFYLFEGPFFCIPIILFGVNKYEDKIMNFSYSHALVEHRPLVIHITRFMVLAIAIACAFTIIFLDLVLRVTFYTFFLCVFGMYSFFKWRKNNNIVDIVYICSFPLCLFAGILLQNMALNHAVKLKEKFSVHDNVEDIRKEYNEECHKRCGKYGFYIYFVPGKTVDSSYLSVDQFFGREQTIFMKHEHPVQ